MADLVFQALYVVSVALLAKSSEIIQVLTNL
jgi:hypothetical protein